MLLSTGTTGRRLASLIPDTWNLPPTSEVGRRQHVSIRILAIALCIDCFYPTCSVAPCILEMIGHKPDGTAAMVENATRSSSGEQFTSNSLGVDAHENEGSPTGSCVATDLVYRGSEAYLDIHAVSQLTWNQTA